jgi:hypothetical protein
MLLDPTAETWHICDPIVSLSGAVGQVRSVGCGRSGAVCRVRSVGCALTDRGHFKSCCNALQGSDRNTTSGIVDGHSYSVLSVLPNVAGSNVNLVKMRNPHGGGEIEGGMFDDDGEELRCNLTLPFTL